MSSYVKAPRSKLDYGFDWGPWLDLVHDTLASSTWEVDLGLDTISDSHDGRISQIWLIGGTRNSDYEATNYIVTVGGREDSRTVVIKVRKR